MSPTRVTLPYGNSMKCEHTNRHPNDNTKNNHLRDLGNMYSQQEFAQWCLRHLS